MKNHKVENRVKLFISDFNQNHSANLKLFFDRKIDMYGIIVDSGIYNNDILYKVLDDFHLELIEEYQTLNITIYSNDDIGVYFNILDVELINCDILTYKTISDKQKTRIQNLGLKGNSIKNDKRNQFSFIYNQNKMVN